MRPLPAFFALLLSLGLVSGFQEDRAAAERTLERFQTYLAQRPFHEQGFERLVGSAVELNGLGQLIADLEAKRSAGDASDADLVILARLYARTDRANAALTILESLSNDDPAFRRNVERLQGALLLEVGRTEEGLSRLDTIAAAPPQNTADTREIEALHVLRAEAALRLGDAERASRAFGDLVAVDPTNFDLNLDVADRLARAGLLEESEARYRAALELAGEDTPRRCRALAALGELYERREAPAAALLAYEDARRQLARGHWLKRSLETRVLAIHTRNNTLPELVTTLRAEVNARPDDLDSRVLLAKTLVIQKDLSGARAELEGAVRLFPRDLALGRELVEVLRLNKDDDARVAELQRLVTEHPQELELYIELGQVLASSGRLEQARLQWERTLEGRLTDPSLCLRLASMHAHHGLFDAAEELIERAITLEPKEIGHFDELARLAVRSGRRERVTDILERAEKVAGQDPQQLELVAQMATAQRDSARGLRLLERAVELAPDELCTLLALTDQLRRAKDTARAIGLLRDFAGRATDLQTLQDAANRIVSLSRADLSKLLQDESSRLTANPDDRVAHLLVARCYEEQRALPAALAAFDKLLALEPNFADVTVRAAQIEERLGQDEAAVARYQTLLGTTPQQRVRWLGELGRLYERLDRNADAVACFDELTRLSPDNPATFREAARAFEVLKEPARARECLRQALRLRPDDGDTKLALATLLDEASAAEEPRGKELAYELAKSVARDPDKDLAARGRSWIYQHLEERGELRATLERMRAELRQNPYDTDRALDVIDLLVRQDELPLALELLDELTRYRPDEPRLLTERSKLLMDLRRFDAALADLEVLLRLPDQDRDELLLRAAQCDLALGRVPRAEERLQGVGDPMRAVGLLQKERLLPQARARLEAELARKPDDPVLLERLMALLRQSGETAAALEVLERIEALAPVSRDSLLRRAELVRVTEGREAYLDTLARALLAIEPPLGPSGEAAKSLTKGEKRALRAEKTRVQREAQPVYSHLNQYQEWYLSGEIAARAAKTAPLRSDLFGSALRHLIEQSRFSDAEALLSSARAELAAGKAPVGETLERFGRSLDASDRQLLRSDPARSAARAAELSAAIDGDPSALTPARINELTALHRQNKDMDALRVVLEAAAERIPRDLRIRANLVTILLDAGDFEPAIGHLRQMLETDMVSPGIDPLRANRKDRERFAKKLSEADAAALTEAHVERCRRLNARAGVDDGWSFNARPNREDVELALARALAATDDMQGASNILRRLEPTHPEHTARGLTVAAVYRDIGLDDEALRLSSALRDAVLEACEDPILRQLVPTPSEVRELISSFGAQLVREDEVARGFELVRRWGGASAVSALRLGPLGSTEASRALATEMYAAWETARASESPVADALDRAVFAFEAAVAVDDYTSASTIAAAALDAAPTSIAWIHCAVDLQQKSQDIDRASALVTASIEAIREEVRQTGKIPRSSAQAAFMDVEPAPEPPYGLSPQRVPRSTTQLASQLSQLTQYVAFQSSNGKPVDYVPWELVVRRIELDWDRRAWAEVAIDLEELIKALGGSGNWIGYQLRDACSVVPRDASALALWKVVHEVEPDDFTGIAAYGAALEDSGAKDEAVQLYSRCVQRTLASSEQRYGEFGAIVERLRELDASKLPLELAPPADLTAAIAADPLNVSLRKIQLDRLLAQQRFPEAAVEARSLAPLVGHLDEIFVRCADALFAAGDDAGFLELIVPRLTSLANDDLRVTRGALAATVSLDLGRNEEALALIRSIFESGTAGMERTSAAIWIARGDTERAVAELRRKRDEVGPAGRSWVVEQIDSALALLAGNAVQSTNGLEALLDQAGANMTAELAESLLGDSQRALDPSALRALAEKRSGPQKQLVEALALRAEGRFEAYEDALVELGLGRRAERDLALLAVTHARERKDFARARALLDRIAAAAPPNARRSVVTPVGALRETDLFEIERAALDLTSGTDSPAGVLERWRAALKDHPTTLFLMAYHAGMPEAAQLGEALPTIRSYAELDSERVIAERALAELQVERGEVSAAFERLLALENGQSEHLPRWVRLVELARELGRLPELRELAIARGTAKERSFAQTCSSAALLAELDGRESALRGLVQWALDGRPSSQLMNSAATAVRELPDSTGLERRLLERIKEEDERNFQWSSMRWRLVELVLVADGQDAALQEMARGDASNDGYARSQCARYLESVGHRAIALQILRSAIDPATVRNELIRLLLASGAAEEGWSIIAEQLADEPVAALNRIGSATRAKLRAFEGFKAAYSAAREAVDAAVDDATRTSALRRLVELERIEKSRGEERLAALEQLARLAPDDPRVLAWLGPDLVAAERFAEALPYIEAKLELEDRARAISNNSWMEPNEEDVRNRIRAMVARDGEGAIERALGDRIGRRFGITTPWMHTVQNLENSIERRRSTDLAFQFGALELFLKLHGDRVLDGSLVDSIVSSRLRTGDTQGALDLAWTTYILGEPEGETCAAIYGEADRLTELEERLARWLLEPLPDEGERDARHETAYQARRHSALQRGALDEVVALERARVARRAWDPGAYEALALALLQTSEYTEGYELACMAARMRSYTFASPDYPDGVRVHRKWPAGGPLRFAYSAETAGRAEARSSTIGGGLMVIGPSDEGDATPWVPSSEATSGEDLRLELALLCGRRDDALALEATRTAKAEDPEAAQLALARSLMRHRRPELDARAEELAQALESAARTPAQAEGAARLLADLARRRGDGAAVERWTAAAAAHRARSGAEPLPEPTALARGLDRLDAGDAAGALPLLEERAVAARRAGRYGREGADLLHGLGQARAAVLGLEAARPDLLRALAEHPTDARAAATRAALGR